MNDFEEKITEELHEEAAETAETAEAVEIIGTPGAEAEEEAPEPAELPTFPCIPLRGLTIFPQTIMHFDIGREKSIQALENRKSIAKQKGEEASTKLLVPMVGMLAVVMIIVIIPAFLSIQM